MNQQGISQDKQQIFICKQQNEKQINKNKCLEWKEARSHFFTETIRNKFANVGATQLEQYAILEIFAKGDGFFNDSMKIDQNNLGELNAYKQQVQQLKSSFEHIQKQYVRKQRECISIQKIINNKYCHLKVIRIQHLPKRYRQNDQQYSISAIEFFKVVNENKQLSQVTLKGFIIKYFQEFIEIVNPLNSSQQIEQKREELNWAKNFCPNKSLKLYLSASIQFYLPENCLSKINNLSYFTSLFNLLSDIKVTIRLGWWEVIYQIADHLQLLWECLKQIKRISITISGYDGQISTQSISIVRFVLFGGLASFTEIIQLAFQGIEFDYAVGANNFLAIQESIASIFQNNQITLLKLTDLFNFPTFPDITTLQQIYLSRPSFWNEFNLMGTVVKSNPILRIIKCQAFKEWVIDQDLLNHLQYLAILTNGATLHNNISSQTPSNLRSLSICFSDIGTIATLQVIFPKLVKLTSLTLRDINFRQQTLELIPSTHLEDLYISSNDFITDEMVKAIDEKWPQLRQLTLCQYSNLTDNFLTICRFEGLTHLRVDIDQLGGITKALHLIKQGIKVC